VHRESEMCVGYFSVGIPGWDCHATGDDFPSLRGLSEEEREERVYDVVKGYYETICWKLPA